MSHTIQKRIRRSTIIIYATILLAALRSVYLEVITTDYAHEVFSSYFVIEACILGLVVVLGLKNRWMRFFLVALTACEIIIFIRDTPISPDEIMMVIIFGLRVYVIAGLFSHSLNGYYKTSGHNVNPTNDRS